jgi:hypothetical protein
MIVILAAVMTSCASVKTKRNRFRKLTKDMRIDTKEEAKLAQTLYIEIMHN